MLTTEAYISGTWTDITSNLKAEELDIITSARINEIKFNLIKSFDTDFTPVVDDMQIRILNGTTELFAGTIYSHLGNTQTGVYECVAYSHAKLFQNTTIIEHYANKSPEYIFADWISKYTDFTYVPTTTSGIVLDDLTIIDKTLDEGITGLCNLTGYAVRINSAKQVYFEPWGITETGLIFETGSGKNIYGLPNWKLDTDNVINRIKFIGGSGRYNYTDLFSGDGSEDTFTLTHIPEDVSVFVSSVLKAPYVLGATSGGDYTVAKEDSNIIFQPGSIPAIGTNNIEVDYTYAIPIRIEQDAAPGLLPSQIREKTITNKSVTTMAGGRRLIRNVFTLFSTALPTAEDVIVPLDPLIVPNSWAWFKDAYSSLNVNNSLVINRIKYSYPSKTFTLSVGQQSSDFVDTIKDLSDKIKDLQAQLGSQGRTQKMIGSKATVRIKIKSVTKHRSYRLLNDSFVIGATEWGTLRDPTKAFVISDFEAVGNWTSDGTLTLDTTNFKTGIGSLKLAMTGAVTEYIENTTDSIDLSGSVGATSGNPTKGCLGLWLRDSNKKVTNLTVKIGSDSSNYVLINAVSYPLDWSDFYTENFFTYYVFKFLDGSVTGTPDWEHVDYIKFDITSTATTDVNIDFLTVSDSNVIGLNALGDRRGSKIISD